ncbi:MAG: CopG family ribbon-helix-helix protein [Candidatus Thorarchaeota archaeon]|nr:CopG family ribbon-helix-helix protein [Candidatus Thorarchaeota archaeon]
MPVVAISMSKEEKAELDALWKEGGFSNRSEVMRHALQSLLSQNRTLEQMRGVVTALVAVELQRGRSEKAQCSEVQHEFAHLITSSLHSHSTMGGCYEIMIVTGDAEDVRMMVKRLRGSKEVVNIHVNFVGG